MHTHIRTCMHTYRHTHTHLHALDYITLHCSTLHYIPLHYTTLLHVTLHCFTLHYIILPYSALHYSTCIHNPTPRNTAQQNTTQHNTDTYMHTYIHACIHTYIHACIARKLLCPMLFVVGGIPRLCLQWFNRVQMHPTHLRPAIYRIYWSGGRCTLVHWILPVHSFSRFHISLFILPKGDLPFVWPKRCCSNRRTGHIKYGESC